MTAPPPLGRAPELVLGRAEWAARAFAGYDGGARGAVVVAVAKTVGEEAGAWAEAVAAWSEKADSLGGDPLEDAAEAVAVATGLAAADPVVGLAASSGDLRLARPLGVVVVVVPAGPPVAALTGAVVSCLATANAVIVVPDPSAAGSSRAIVSRLAAAAEDAGAPAGAVQLASPGDVAGLAADPRVTLVAEGGPAGAVPIVVAAGAELDAAAATIVAWADRHGSRPRGAASVVIVDAALRAALGCELDASGVLLADVEALVPEDPLSRPQPAPVIPVLAVGTGRQAVAAVRAAVRVAGGAGPLAAVFAGPSHVGPLVSGLAAAGFPRVAVNTTPSPWSAADLVWPAPAQLVRWTEVRGATDWAASRPAAGLHLHASVPPYPHPSNRPEP